MSSTPAGGGRLSRTGSPIVTPFIRLARAHAFHAAGDAIVVIALAGSLFFSLDVNAARSRILLYLVLTMAPFALVGPLIGPALDRMRGGRRLMIVLTFVVRALLMILMIPNMDTLWLFPLAFAQLVMGKTYAVAKAATVPTTAASPEELVEKNSRLAVLSAVAGGVGAAPALGLQPLFGTTATLGYAFIMYCIGLVFAIQLPRVVVDDPEVPDDVLDLRSAGVRLAASATAVMRGVVGFVFFLLIFEFSRVDELDLEGIGKAVGAAVKSALGFELLDTPGPPRWKIALPFGFWGLGIFAGNVVAPRIRERVTEENMILGALGAVFAAAVAGIWAGGLSGAALLALVVGSAPSAAKLAFDSLVQRDAPGANHGAAFGRFETRFQIAWVIGALIAVLPGMPLVPQMPLRVGFLIVAIAAGFAVATYRVGSQAIRGGGANRAPLLSGRFGRTPKPAAEAEAEVELPYPNRVATADTRSATPHAVAPEPARDAGPAPTIDPYAAAFADRPIEPPDWASAVFDDEQPPPTPPAPAPPGAMSTAPEAQQWSAPSEAPPEVHVEPHATPPMGIEAVEAAQHRDFWSEADGERQSVWSRQNEGDGDDDGTVTNHPEPGSTESALWSSEDPIDPNLLPPPD